MMLITSLIVLLLRTCCAQRRPSRQMLDESVPLPPTHRTDGLNVPAFAAFNRYRSNQGEM